MYNLRVYRNISGIRVPYDIQLDKHRNVVSEEVNSAELSLQMKHPDSYVLGPPVAAPNDISQFLPTVPTIGPGNVVHHVPLAGMTDFTRKFVEWSARVVPPLPNPFPGTEALREEFFKAMNDEEAAAEAEGRQCSDCELGRVANQYKQKLKKAVGV